MGRWGMLVVLAFSLVTQCVAYENSFPFQVDFTGGRVVLDIDSYQAVWYDRTDNFSNVGNYSIEKRTYTAVVDMTNSTDSKLNGNVSFFVDLDPENGSIIMPWVEGDDSLLNNSAINISSISELDGELHEFNAFGLWYAFVLFEHGAVAISADSESDRAGVLEILYFEQGNIQHPLFVAQMTLNIL